MKLRQVEFACAVAECGSFVAAAARCGATQPTLSSGLRLLEDALGGPLFSRTTRTVTLTPFGRHMLPVLQGLLDARREVARAAEEYRNPARRMLRIGVSPLADMGMIAQVMAPYRATHPEVEVFFKECLLDDISHRLDQDTVDLALVPEGTLERHRTVCAFYRDALFYLPRGGVDPGLPGPLALSDLPSDPVILTGGGCGLNGALERVFAAEGATLIAYAGQALSYQVICDWVDLGIGAGILPGAKISGSATARPLTRADGTQAVLRFDWMRLAGAPPRTHVQDFLDYLSRTGPAIIGGSEAFAGRAAI